MENASYLQSMEENISQDEIKKEDNNLDTFEVDSIELATPDLFSDNIDENSFNQDNDQSETTIFEESKSNQENNLKEQEMFSETNSEEDFEIPAFLRRQKN